MSLSRKEKIVIFAVILFVCVIVVGSGIYEKKQSEPKAKNRFFENPFSEVDPGIDQQSGNYANDALVVDGYVYFYKSRVKLGNYDKIDELEKCGNNVIYRLSPDGTYEEFYTFEEGDAIYYSIGSKLYYYEGYFYIQIENRIYRINKEGTEAQVIYENVGGYGSYVTFGIRDHYLVLQKQTEYYYLDMDTWDWSQPIEVGRMWHLMNVRCSYDAVRRNQLICFFENVIYGTEKEEPIGVYFESNMLYGSDFVYLHDLRVYDEDAEEKVCIAGSVYCLNVYKRVMFYAQKEDDSICIKYYSLDDKQEGELITIDAGADTVIKSLVVSDDYIIYDLGPKKEKEAVDKRVIWNRHTGETQQVIEYQ